MHPQLLELERDSSPVADIPFLLSLRNQEEFSKAHSFGPLKVPHIGKCVEQSLLINVLVTTATLFAMAVFVSRRVWCRVYPLFHCGSAVPPCHSQVSSDACMGRYLISVWGYVVGLWVFLLQCGATLCL